MASILTVNKTENAIPGKYIVTLKEDVSLASHVSSTQASIASTDSNITHELDIINGYAGDFTEDDLNDLLSHPEVASIEQDSIVKTCAVVTQNDAPWGLGRITSEVKLTGSDSALNFKYTYDSSGKGANVYVIDTGIFIKHPAFQGRASWGKTFGPYKDADGNGHGTHCAGTIISGPYGVAKSSHVIAVKVLSDQGSGSNSDVIAGINWVAQEARRTGKPTVASMSLGGGASNATDAAVVALYNAGVTVVVAAGNDNKDAKDSSPARVRQAITVAASTIQDAKATFSNFGAVVDIWAPGLNVISTWNDGKTKSISGTSMATPHVAGFAAYLLGLDSTLTPAKVAQLIDTKSLKNALTGVPAGTVNKLLND